LRFHMVLLRAAGNHLAMRIIEDNRIMTMMFSDPTGLPDDVRKIAEHCDKNLKLHGDIHEAVHRRDPKAARRAMTAHMRLAAKNMFARFDWLEKSQDRRGEVVPEYPESLRAAVRAIEQGE
jgi:DNA-binding FadR family transcriptional regulator